MMTICFILDQIPGSIVTGFFTIIAVIATWFLSQYSEKRHRKNEMKDRSLKEMKDFYIE